MNDRIPQNPPVIQDEWEKYPYETGYNHGKQDGYKLGHADGYHQGRRDALAEHPELFSDDG